MNKLFQSIFILLILNLSLVLAVPPTITPTTLNVIGANGDILTKTFNVTNNQGGVVSFSFDISALDLKDNDDDEINLSFSGGAAVGSGSTAIITMTANVDSRMDFDTFGGTLTVSDGSESSNMQLNLEIQPGICDEGIVGDDLELTISEPDSGDEYKPGDYIEGKVEVRNKGTDDMDIQVQAFLINDDDELATSSSDVENVEDGNEEDFTFRLRIPLDSENIQEDEDMRLFVKAFDDDSENENCVQASQSLDIQLEDGDVIFDTETSSIQPSILTCGESAFASLDFINIGDEDQDNIYVTLESSKLGYNERSTTYDLDDFNSDERNSGNARFDIEVPDDTKEGRYDFMATVYGEDSTDTLELSLEVASCTTGPVEITDTSSVIEVPDRVSVEKGMPIFIPVKINNNEDVSIVYYAELRDAQDFSNSVSAKQITIPGKRSATVFLAIEARDDAAPGTYSATVNVRTPTQNIGSKTVTVDVTGEGGSSLTGDDAEFGSFTLWTIFIAVLVILIAVIVGVLISK